MNTLSSSFKGAQLIQTPQHQVKSVRAPRQVVCQAENNLLQKVNKAVSVALIATTLGLGTANMASADISGLTRCADSKAFTKRQKKEVKDLSKRQKLYEEGSAPFLALQATIERTEARFKSYGKSNLLCGSDGYPHLVSEPGYAIRSGHAGETFIPTFVFLYIAGFIGYAGRKYLQAIRSQKNPGDAEIIIDVPLAIKIITSSFLWPGNVVSELANGQLIEDDNKITVSPR